MAADIERKSFSRSNPLFSQCGLNCGLCTMRLGGHCPGCGQGNRPCKAARCGIEHGVEYCYECNGYPCELYVHADDKDSFITRQHMKSDMEKARRIGIEAYNAEQKEKRLLLDELLTYFNDGRRKSFYCLAVNLLDVYDIRGVLNAVKTDMKLRTALQPEKINYIVSELTRIADAGGILLKLRKDRNAVVK